MNLAAMARRIYKRTGTTSSDWGASGVDLVDALNSANEYFLACIRNRTDNFYPTAWSTTDLSTGTALPVFDALFHEGIPLRIIGQYGSDNGKKNVQTAFSEMAIIEDNMKRFYGTRIFRVVTVTIATPGVFSRKNHGLRSGDRVILSTTSALPTGLSAATWYYVISEGLGTDTFELSLTKTGSAIATSGSQTGTQYFATDVPDGFGRRRQYESNK